jgi:hypothetical protein
MSDEQTGEQRRAAKMRQEVEQFENDARARFQVVLDRWYEGMMADKAEEDAWDYSTGYRERRRPTCHRGKGDPDW